MKNFYITTTLPYVNGKPHIGFALEIVEADVIARFHRAQGEEVVFNTGTDEHGKKILQEAEAIGKTAQEYCNEMSAYFRNLKEMLNISWTNFIRTTDTNHIHAAQEFWRRCLANGDIYKKQYKTKYCVGCELEKTDSELTDGRCPIHPNREIELIEEENYFFRFSKYQGELLALYKKRQNFVVPEKRLNEIRAFVDRGLEDFSISRVKEKMPWGIPVPDDDEHVMYVWFDALVNYISTIGWSEDAENFGKFWPGVQICGKDNLRPQAAMWQAMLLSARLPNSERILVNGFIKVDGQKMSKSLGNVLSPQELVDRFGVDGARYLLLSLGPIGEDFDISWSKLIEKYNADLANGLGNLVSRVLKLGEKLEAGSWKLGVGTEFPKEFSEILENYRLSEGLDYIWNIVRESNRFIEREKPWEIAKTDTGKFEAVMTKLLNDVSYIAFLLSPFLPETSGKIQSMLEKKKADILFERIR